MFQHSFHQIFLVEWGTRRIAEHPFGLAAGWRATGSRKALRAILGVKMDDTLQLPLVRLWCFQIWCSRFGTVSAEWVSSTGAFPSSSEAAAAALLISPSFHPPVGALRRSWAVPVCLTMESTGNRPRRPQRHVARFPGFCACYADCGINKKLGRLPNPGRSIDAFSDRQALPAGNAGRRSVSRHVASRTPRAPARASENMKYLNHSINPNFRSNNRKILHFF